MTKIPCRMVALDLDGTLLNSNHVVTDRNCIALRDLSKEGVIVVLVSGRMHQSILPISDQIGLENPIISYNGGMVKHAKLGKCSITRPLRLQPRWIWLTTAIRETYILISASTINYILRWKILGVNSMRVGQGCVLPRLGIFDS